MLDGFLLTDNASTNYKIDFLLQFRRTNSQNLPSKFMFQLINQMTLLLTRDYIALVTYN